MNRRQIAVAFAGVLCLVVVAYFVGRAPQQNIQLEEKATEAAKAQVVEIFGTAETGVLLRDVEQQTDTIRTIQRGPSRTTHPDGTIEERGPEVEVVQTADRRTEQTAGHVHREEQAARVETVEVVREVERRVEVEAARPDWRAAALVGLDVKNGELVYGAELDRRIFGPISLGVWGLSSGAAGLAAAVEF